MGPLLNKVLSTTAIVLGVILFVLGFVVQFSLFPKILEDQIYANLELTEGTEAWDGFVSQNFWL